MIQLIISYRPSIIRHNACIPSFTETICGYYEKKLLGDLMRPYNYLERPVVNESEPLMLTFGITLQQIIDVVSALHEHEMTPSPRRVSGGQFNRH